MFHTPGFDFGKCARKFVFTTNHGNQPLTKQEQHFSLSVMLGIAFSANAGGISTVIGTPPNSVLIGLLENEYNMEISFLKWMIIGRPFSAIMIAVIYVVLTRWMFPDKGIEFASSNELIAQKLMDLGPTSPEEKHVLRIFTVTVFLWVFRSLINSIFPNLGLSDTIISMGCAIALFSVPFKFKEGVFYNISSKTQFGTDGLFKIIKEKISQDMPPESIYISRERHLKCIEKVNFQLKNAKKDKNIDLIAEDIRISIKELGNLFGNVDIEDILDIIFSDFCIGK